MQAPLRLALVAALVVPFLGCNNGGSGGGSGSSGSSSFLLLAVNVPEGGQWKLDRQIELTFNRPVDFASVTPNSVAVRSHTGAPVPGEYRLQADDPRVVVFQPACPLLEDLSDTGLKPAGTYQLDVPGLDQGSFPTVRAVDGAGLAEGEAVNFTTPSSTLPADLFHDPVAGGPTPLVRPLGSDLVHATHLELGGDPANRVYFERDPASGAITLEPPLELPLNLYSVPGSQVVLVLAFDQPVHPAAANLAAGRLGLQYRDQLGDWQPRLVQPELVANCPLPGALVRLRSPGVLPSEALLRAVVAAELTDLVGEPAGVVHDAFALATTEPAPGVLADELLEDFDAVGAASWEDRSTPLAEPRAVWKDGLLVASTGGESTGGPNGTFDWLVPAGQTLLFDTVHQVIVGGPHFAPTDQQTVVDGVVHVRHMRVAQGATVVALGPNPLQIHASGQVEILGTIDVSGSSNLGVVTLNTTNIPELGAPGQAGGGRGGTGSPLTNASSPKGGDGFGAFDAPGTGGGGGETGWDNVAASMIAARRGAGGGGGAFDRNQPRVVGAMGVWDQRFIGLDAEPGFGNLASGSMGAISGASGPHGGRAGPLAFVDGDNDNDFFGRAIDPATGTVTVGELKTVWGGAGGGGGGDASFVGAGGSFPMSPFDPAGDEKGSGGGGGAGGLRIAAVGDIRFGPMGRLRARGGTGGGGENTSFTNRVGGGSGGGAGGHVVLESAGEIDFSQVVLGPPNTFDAAILATGGQGGVGANNIGGATDGNQSTPFSDACPPGYPSATMLNGCRGHVHGAGGDGGPGLVQLHTANGAGGIVLPPGATFDELSKPRPLVRVGAGTLLPSVGARSRALSVWIPLGQGGFVPSAATALHEPAAWSFGGVNPQSGSVVTSGGYTDGGGFLLPPAPLAAAPALPHLAADGRSAVFDATALAPDSPLLANTRLLERYRIVLTKGQLERRCLVASADHDAQAGTLTLHLAAGEPTLLPSAAAGSQIGVERMFFGVETHAVPDHLPAPYGIAFRFQATAADTMGLPDPAAATPFTSDLPALGSHPQAADFRFLRFDVLFELGPQGLLLDPGLPMPALDYVRMPFRY